jgi:hypothetical protein
MTHFLFVVPTDEQLTEAKIYDLFHLLTPALDLLCSFYKRHQEMFLDSMSYTDKAHFE